MKKIISLMIVFVMMLSICPTVFAEERIDVTYSYTRDGVIYLGTANLLVGHSNGDHFVVDGYSMFSRAEVIDRIDIPATTTVGNKSIILSEGCLSGLPAKKIVFFEGIHTLPKNVCRDSLALETVEIPKSVREIGDYAFKGCTNLRNGGTIYAENIGNEAFLGCSNLVMNVQNARLIGEGAFDECNNVTGIKNIGDSDVEFVNGEAVVGGITYTLKNKEVWITGCDKSFEGEVIIPEKIAGFPVTNIVYPGFYDCSKITKVVMPNSMKELGTSVFWNCNSLYEVVLNYGLEKIGPQAFEYCSGLKEIKIPNTLTKIDEMAFKGSGIRNIEISESVTYIGDGAFWDCDNLTSIVIPDSVTTLGTNESIYPLGYYGGVRADKKLSPFYGCETLETVTIGKGVEKIYADLFYDCNSLKEINISENNNFYKSVDGVVYTKDMKKLVCFPKGKRYSVYTIPEGVGEIGEKALSCSTLTTLYKPVTLNNIHGDNLIPENIIDYTSISDLPDEAKGILPMEGVYNGISWKLESGVLYLTGQGSLNTTIDGKYTPVPWEVEAVYEVVIGEGINNIYGVLKNHTNIKRVTLPSSLVGIYDLSFYNCKNLESIIIPSGVTHIGSMAFGQCYSLKSVKVMSEGELFIYHGAFDIADGAVVHLPDNIKWMDRLAFTHIYNTGGNKFGANSSPQDVTIVANAGGYVEEWCVNNSVKFRTPLGVKVKDSILAGYNIYEENSVIYVSGRAAFTALGITVDCDDAEKIAVCGEGSNWMIFSNGNTYVTTASGVVELENPVKWVEGVFMVPKEALEKLGFGEIIVTEAGNVKNSEESYVGVEIGGEISVNLNDITVSQIPEAENGAYNMIDGLTTTRWSAEVTDKTDPCWAIFDLGEVYKLDKIGLSFYRDLIRKSEFSVEVSCDGVNYTTAIERRLSVGLSEEVEYYPLNGVEARYVRLSGYGNTSPYSNIMNWFSPTEVEICKVGAVVVEDVPKETVKVDANGKFDLKNAKISASIITEPQNGPDNLCDGNFSSYCVVYVQDTRAPQFMQIDLGDAYDVDYLNVAFRLPKARTTFFDIRVSKDGEDFTTIVPQRGSDPNANPFETFQIDRKVRYIRIYGYSNTYNQNWVSVTEAEVYINK